MQPTLKSLEPQFKHTVLGMPRKFLGLFLSRCLSLSQAILLPRSARTAVYGNLFKLATLSQIIGVSRMTQPYTNA